MPASYKIPQNVDLEDKIFGPLTLKQFLYLLGAGLVTFISFSTIYTALPAVFYVVTAVTWIVAVAFIFVRPNDQPFSRFINSFLWFALHPNRRVWRRLPSLKEIKLHDDTDVPKVVAPARPSEEEARTRLQRLAHVVDTRGWSSLDDADINGRITSGEAKPKLNIFMAEEDEPEDILAKEEVSKGSNRTTAELDRMLKQGVSKPTLNKSARKPDMSPQHS